MKEVVLNLINYPYNSLTQLSNDTYLILSDIHPGWPSQIILLLLNLLLAITFSSKVSTPVIEKLVTSILQPLYYNSSTILDSVYVLPVPGGPWIKYICSQSIALVKAYY